MDWDTLLGPIATGALGAISEILPLAVPVLVALISISVAIRIFGKFGARR